jgi:hypothetical protein
MLAASAKIVAREGTIGSMNRSDSERWLYLSTAEAAPLVRAVEAMGSSPSANAIAKLRRTFDHDDLRLAIDLVGARRLAARKFPSRPHLLCDRQGIEQASSEQTAAWKARRFGSEPVLDLCCGIGGDAMALAARGPTVGVDRSPARSVMCHVNAGIETRTDEVSSVELDAPLIHIDPARRDEVTGKRRWALEALEPSVMAIAKITDAVEGGAIKLGPGLGRDEALPFGETTLEFLAEHGSIVQAVVWFGSLATAGALRRASDAGTGISIEGVPRRPEYRSTVGQFLLTPHVAIERAELLPQALGPLDARELAPGLGLLSCDEVPETPWFSCFRVDAVMSPRLPKVKAWLRAHDGGQVVVRTRDQAIDADAWTRSLQGSGATEFVLFGLRLGKKIVVLATQRGSSAP